MRRELDNLKDVSESKSIIGEIPEDKDATKTLADCSEKVNLSTAFDMKYFNSPYYGVKYLKGIPEEDWDFVIKQLKIWDKLGCNKEAFDEFNTACIECEKEDVVRLIKVIALDDDERLTNVISGEVLSKSIILQFNQLPRKSAEYYDYNDKYDPTLIEKFAESLDVPPELVKRMSLKGTTGLSLKAAAQILDKQDSNKTTMLKAALSFVEKPGKTTMQTAAINGIEHSKDTRLIEIPKELVPESLEQTPEGHFTAADVLDKLMRDMQNNGGDS